MALASLRSNRIAGDDDFHATVFLSTFVRVVIRHGLGLAQLNLAKHKRSDFSSLGTGPATFIFSQSALRLCTCLC